MNVLLMKSARLPRSSALSEAPLDLARKADTCVKVLVEARKLSTAGQYGTLQNQLIARAGELLDDMDEILVALDPTGNGQSFAIAATLHRELEQVQTTITNLRRREFFSRNAADKR